MEGFAKLLSVFSTEYNKLSGRNSKFCSSSDIKMTFHLLFGSCGLHHKTCAIWATSWENLLYAYPNNKGADQPAHPRSLVSAFVVLLLDSIIPTDALPKFSTLACFCSWADQFRVIPGRKPPKTGFLVTWLILKHVMIQNKDFSCSEKTPELKWYEGCQKSSWTSCLKFNWDTDYFQSLYTLMFQK